MHSQCVRARVNVCVNSDALQVGKVMGLGGVGGARGWRRLGVADERAK